jgi:ectoine hydroxylase-related dioxygenase (phytanoyl-CoA dioxygenase family)
MRFNKTTKEHLQSYDEEGFVIIRNLLDPVEVECLLERVDGMFTGRYPNEGFVCGSASRETENDPGKLIKQIMPIDLPVKDELLAEWYDHSILKSCASFLLNTSCVEAFQQQILLKEPGGSNGTPWHQDNFYWKLSVGGITAWTPLLPTSEENGTMWLLPRSHKSGVLEHRPAGGVSRFHTITETIDLTNLIPLDMNVGDVSFHHPQLIHGAKGNNGQQRRVSLAMHFKDAGIL